MQCQMQFSSVVGNIKAGRKKTTLAFVIHTFTRRLRDAILTQISRRHLNSGHFMVDDH